MKTIYSIILLLFITQVSNAQIQGYNLNDVVSDFTVTDIHGEEHNLYSYTAAGKYVWIDFSFVTCGPCQIFAPKFNEFYDKYGCNNGEVVCMSMFGINNDTNADVELFDTTYGGAFNHVPSVSTEGGASPVDADFNPAAYPTICLINPDNQIIELDIWPVNTIAELEASFPTGFNPSPMSCNAASGNFTIATPNGTPITDGSVHTFSHLGDPDGTIGFNITNTSGDVIDMRLEFVSMTNADDTGDWICVFGVCLPPANTTPGDIFPIGGASNSFTTIDPGVTTDYGDHFYNTDPGNGTYPLEYVFKFFEVDGSGNEIGESITFTYQYDGTASVEDFAQVGFKLYPTVSSDYLNLEVNESVSAKIINTQGQLIKQYNFETGNHTIDVSSLAKQMYYLKLSNTQGAQSLAKFIVN